MHTKTISTDAEPPSLVPGTMAYEGQAYDIMLHAWMGRFTGWMSPASLGLALYDWLAHLLISPAKQFDINKDSVHKAWQFWLYAINYCTDTEITPCVENSTDPRFKNELWQNFPFNFYTQAFLAVEQQWDEATSRIRGVSKHHQNVVNFTMRQILDVFSPSNYLATNPEVLQRCYFTGGQSLVAGYKNFLDDVRRYVYELPPAGMESFEVGKNLAITPGKVIYRNRLIELIQYTPTTTTVYPEPILIIPAWIMKYYILDLSSHDSLVKYLVSKGHTVFIISWKNPTSSDRDLGLEEYLNLGVMDAMNAINHIVPKHAIHTVGYCLGGTLLMMAAAALAAKSDERIKSITLLAAQVDFKEAGEILLFVDQSQAAFLEDVMWEKGYLDGSQMARAFSMLRSNDLIWSRLIHDYLLGTRKPMNDLIAWDMDTTRLPFRMHTEYLHNLFINNDLSQGRFKVNHKRIALTDVTAPIFAVGTTKDHISPWRSVYKITLFTNTEVTFVLTNGGHNAGIVSEPGHKGREYHMGTRKVGNKHISSDTWVEATPKHEGSWWPAWQEWLASYSGKRIKPPNMGNAAKGYSVLCDAPGTYVLEK